MALGSVYLAGAYFFAPACMFGAPWRRVAAGFPAVILFVWMAAIATILSTSTASIKDSLPFAAWAALYIVTPFAVPLLYVRNRRRCSARPAAPAAGAALRPSRSAPRRRARSRSACSSSWLRTSAIDAGRGRSPR